MTALASKGSSAYADNTVNKIYYQDAPSYFDGTLNIFKEFDVPPQQLRIEAQIVEIELNDDFNFGTQLDAWKEALPENVDMSFDFKKAENMAENGLAVGQWGKFAAQSINLQGIRPKAAANIINFLVRKGYGKVLSSPTVVALNGQQATIASLDNISFKAYTTPDAPLSKQASIGVSLSITPTIASESITLAINAAVNSLVGWGNGNEPVINTRTTTANIVLKDGEVFTLSGLRKDTIAKSDDGVPILRSVPLLGYAFRHEIDVKKTSEIVVILTPHKVTSENAVAEKDKKFLKDVQDAVQEEKSEVDKFVDRVILNK